MMTRDNNPNPVTKAAVMPGRTWAEAEGLRPSGASLSCSSIYLFILNHDRSSDGRRPKTTCYFVWGLQRSEAYHEAGKYKQKSQCFVICWIFCPSIDANFLAWRLPWPKCQKKEKKFHSIPKRLIWFLLFLFFFHFNMLISRKTGRCLFHSLLLCIIIIIIIISLFAF
jgi:hypothetical protein